MTGYNMPPGCNVSDIPGNNAPDPSPFSEAWLELYEPLILMTQDGLAIKASTLQHIADATVEMLEKLVTERDYFHEQADEANKHAIAGFYEEEVPSFKQGAPTHELENWVTAREVRGYVASIVRLREFLQKIYKVSGHAVIKELCEEALNEIRGTLDLKGFYSEAIRKFSIDHFDQCHMSQDDIRQQLEDWIYDQAFRLGLTDLAKIAEARRIK